MALFNGMLYKDLKKLHWMGMGLILTHGKRLKKEN
jgi:hypothetical protein